MLKTVITEPEILSGSSDLTGLVLEVVFFFFSNGLDANI